MLGTSPKTFHQRLCSLDCDESRLLQELGQFHSYHIPTQLMPGLNPTVPKTASTGTTIENTLRNPIPAVNLRIEPKNKLQSYIDLQTLPFTHITRKNWFVTASAVLLLRIRTKLDYFPGGGSICVKSDLQQATSWEKRPTKCHAPDNPTVYGSVLIS